MLVATAGHIDHGKTSLIRALTGVETDRLPEEKRRGISIDLGFAYWTPEGGETIGFVDVPGHERFVRNMLAGVGGVDTALLVVAADDGVMPQTIEHLQILDLLGIRRGLVTITKCDAAARERIDAVRGQVDALLAPTSLAGALVFEVSSLTGSGVPALAEALKAARADTPRADRFHRNFRLAIDRAFTVTGIGTVVTGTVLDGTLESGAKLVVAPRGREARVRGLQSAGTRVTQVAAGQRCALNLAGVEVADVHRGDWLVLPDRHIPTMRIEARLDVVASREEPVKHYMPVHLHLGTADIAARILIPRQQDIAPGASGIVQLALEDPTVAVTGDRFVVRGQSGRALVGGGVVIDPFATADRRTRPTRPPITAAMQNPDPAQILAALLAILPHEIDAKTFEHALNLTPEAAHVLYAGHDVVLLGKPRLLALPGSRVTALVAKINERLDTFHREHPEATGLTLRALKAGLGLPVSTGALNAVLRDLSDKRLVDLGGALVKLASHAVTLTPHEDELWRKLLFWQDERRIVAFFAADLVRELRSSQAAVNALLHRRRIRGDLWRVGVDRFMLRGTVAALAEAAAALTRDSGGIGFTVAEYRDATGIGRNLIIKILELFDEVGVTARQGDRRIALPDFASIVDGSELLRTG